MELHALTVRRLFNAVGMGNAEIVRQCLEGVCFDHAASRELGEADPDRGEGLAGPTWAAASVSDRSRSCWLIPPIDPNLQDRRGTPALILAVRTRIVESAVVDTLLDAGADPGTTDAAGLTALDYSRRRLAILGDKPDRIRRSESLDQHGELRLTASERCFLREMRTAAGVNADEVEDLYLQTRRQAALRQFMPRRELKIIIGRLEEAEA